MHNISNNIPQNLKIRKCSPNVVKIREYEFIKKYNKYNYLYREITTGFYECFGVQDLGLIVSKKEKYNNRKE